MSSSTERRGLARRQKLQRFVAHWLPHGVVFAIGPALFAIAAVTAGDHFHFGRHHRVGVAPTLIVIGVVLLLLASFWLVRRQRRLAQLEDEGRDLLHRAEGGEQALIRLARLELDDLRLRLRHYSNERMSLFRCEGDSFALFARFSANPVFDRSAGRDGTRSGRVFSVRRGTMAELTSVIFRPPGTASIQLVRGLRPRRDWASRRRRQPG